MKDYGILVNDPALGEERLIYSETGPEGLRKVKMYLPGGVHYDTTKKREYRIAVRDVSEWRELTDSDM